MLTLMPLSSNWRGQLNSAPLGERAWDGVVNCPVALVGWPWQAQATGSAVNRTNGREVAKGTLRLRGSITGTEKAPPSDASRPFCRVNAAFLSTAVWELRTLEKCFIILFLLWLWLCVFACLFGRRREPG